MILAQSASTTLRWHALPPLWVLVLVVLPLVLLGVRFFYRREAGRVGRRLRIAMGLLRAAAVLLVLGALFGPYTETIEGLRFKRHLILCIDTSSSMGIHDLYQSNPELAAGIAEAAGYDHPDQLATRSRLEIVRDVLGRDRDYLERLAEQFRLHVYSFDASTVNLMEPREGDSAVTTAERALRVLTGLKAQGITQLGAAIGDLVKDFDARNEPVAGILLVTDGRHTGGAPYPVDEAKRAATGTREGIPIFPVWVGDPGVAINVGVSRIDAPEVTLAGDEVYFTATVHARGLEGKPARLVAEVLDASGKTVVDQLVLDADPFELPGEGEAKKVSFRHTFHEPGRYNLRIGVPRWPGEAVEGDNWQRHVLRVVELKMRVLLVSSAPSYSYRFLKEALFRAEETMEANILLLSAEPEWPQEASRGAAPILEWPREKKDLAAYDVIVLLDVDPRDRRITAGRPPEEVYEMLDSWVKRGGGLVLQAGRDGAIPAAWDDPTLQALLPVVPYRGMRSDTLTDQAAPTVEKLHRLTQAGASHPIMRVLQNSDRVRDFWESGDYATEYWWYAPVERAKSSATVLSVRIDRNAAAPYDPPQPILALQDYGLGKVLWLGTDELWRMRRYVENRYYWRFWSGAIRHLATYRLLSGNKRIKIWVDRGDAHYQTGEPVTVEAKFLDENFEPVKPVAEDPSTMTRTLKLRAPDQTEEDITLYAIVDDQQPEGLFRTRVAAGAPGTYSLVAQPDKPGEEVAETTFVVEDRSIEMSDPLLDMDTLRRIAAASKGEVLGPADFRNLLDNPKVPSTSIVRSGEPKRTDLWDRGWVLWLAVGLLGIEWILRRRNLLL